ncbi:MAG: T9SS type A sorting domain-containing protein [Bacteroidota bacterium]
MSKTLFTHQKFYFNFGIALICCLLPSAGIKAQFLNGSFEDWNSGNLMNWVTSEASEPGSAVQSSDAHQGNYALKLKVVYDNLGLVATPFALNLFSLTTVPQVVSCWVKGSLEPNNQLSMYFTLNQNDSAFDLLAYGDNFIPNVGSVYQYQMLNVNNIGGASLLGLGNVYFSIDALPGFSNDTASFVLIDEVNLTAGSSGTSLYENETAVIERIYPNPSEEFTWLQFNVTQPSAVRIVLYDVLGNEVQQCFNQFMSAGKFKTEINTSSLGSGMYVCKLMMDENIYTERLLRK